MPLTDLAIRSLSVEQGQKDFPDRDGLFLRVGVRKKTWIVTIRRNGRRTYERVGFYPQIGLSKARTIARERQVNAQPAPDSFRFNTALELYTQHHLPTIRPGTRYECERSLRGYFLPVFGTTKLGSLTTPMIAGVLDRIEKPAERRNAFVWIRAFLNWHISRGHIDLNPAARLKGLGASRSRDRVLDDRELKLIWNAPPEGKYRAFLRLLILTGQRRGQWHAFEPIMLDRENRLIVFPGSVMKSGKIHVIPATDMMIELLRHQPFTGFNADHRKADLQRQTGTADWTHHDLRRTAATRMSELGTPPHIVERLLAHSMPNVMGRYLRASYLPELREAFAGWERYLSDRVAG